MHRVTNWPSAPTTPLLNEGEIHVWRIDLEDADGSLHGLLSADERERADRMADKLLRNRFIQARGAMRSILGRYLNLPPEAIGFQYGKRGKPSLARTGSGLGFNLTHSRGLALLALGHGEIGVDLEPVRNRSNLRKIGERVFAASVQEELNRLQGDALLQAFFRHWTALEACAKYQGISLFDPTSHSSCKTCHFIPEQGWMACIASGKRLPDPEQWGLYRF